MTPSTVLTRALLIVRPRLSKPAVMDARMPEKSVASTSTTMPATSSFGVSRRDTFALGATTVGMSSSVGPFAARSASACLERASVCVRIASFNLPARMLSRCTSSSSYSEKASSFTVSKFIPSGMPSATFTVKLFTAKASRGVVMSALSTLSPTVLIASETSCRRPGRSGDLMVTVAVVESTTKMDTDDSFIVRNSLAGAIATAHTVRLLRANCDFERPCTSRWILALLWGALTEVPRTDAAGRIIDMWAIFGVVSCACSRCRLGDFCSIQSTVCKVSSRFPVVTTRSWGNGMLTRWVLSRLHRQM
mmetsp:Transcript_31739/g.69372  ORF Transcript_31739/g.69372 Transcript_31739/m.69372 type:complete len:306 (-) Transcript_31739:47-964(-)